MKTPTHDHSVSKLVTALNTLISRSFKCLSDIAAVEHDVTGSLIIAFFIFLFFTSLSVSVLFVAL